MAALEKEQREYPLKVKAELAALTNLQKGFTVLEKNQDAKIKQGVPCDTIESQFQMNTELSTTLVSLMKYVGNHTRP